MDFVSKQRSRLRSGVTLLAELMDQEVKIHWPRYRHKPWWIGGELPMHAWIIVCFERKRYPRKRQVPRIVKLLRKKGYKVRTRKV